MYIGEGAEGRAFQAEEKSGQLCRSRKVQDAFGEQQRAQCSLGLVRGHEKRLEGEVGASDGELVL